MLGGEDPDVADDAPRVASEVFLACARRMSRLLRRRSLLLGRIFSTAVHPLRAPCIFLGLVSLGLAFWFCARHFSHRLSDNRDSFPSHGVVGSGVSVVQSMCIHSLYFMRVQ